MKIYSNLTWKLCVSLIIMVLQITEHDYTYFGHEILNVLKINKT